MAKLKWNTFVAKHPTPYGIVVKAPPRLPPSHAYDKVGRKLPTPYALFQQWAHATFLGDWSSDTASGGFYVSVESLADVTAAQAKFGVKGGWTTSKFSKQVTQVTFDWNGYVAAAKQFGFTP